MSDGGCFIPRDQGIVDGSAVLAQNRYMQTRGRSLMSPEFGRVHHDELEKSTVEVYLKHGPFIDSIKGPLSARGWTLQERELSPRILHYTKHQVLWECRDCIASETKPEARA
jgi:hypothetical protein